MLDRGRGAAHAGAEDRPADPVQRRRRVRILGEATTTPSVECLAAYGRDLGAAFQVADDLLDALATTDGTARQERGKGCEVAGKATLVALLGPGGEAQTAGRHALSATRAIAHLDDFGETSKRCCVRWPAMWYRGGVDPMTKPILTGLTDAVPPRRTLDRVQNPVRPAQPVSNDQLKPGGGRTAGGDRGRRLHHRRPSGCLAGRGGTDGGPARGVHHAAATGSSGTSATRPTRTRSSPAGATVSAPCAPKADCRGSPAAPKASTTRSAPRIPPRRFQRRPGNGGGARPQGGAIDPGEHGGGPARHRRDRRRGDERGDGLRGDEQRRGACARG